MVEEFTDAEIAASLEGFFAEVDDDYDRQFDELLKVFEEKERPSRAVKSFGIESRLAYLRKSFDEAKHPRDDGGRFVSADRITAAKGDKENTAALRAEVTDPKERAKLDKKLEEVDEGKEISHENKTVVPELTKKWAETGAADGYRIQAAGKPMPKKSADMWDSDGELRETPREMAGTSSYANLINAIEDMILGSKESVTGENYSENAVNDGHEPELLVLFGQQVDAPGAETVVKNAKVGARFTRAEVEEAFRETIKPHVDAGDDKLPLGELLENYRFNYDELSGVEGVLRRMAVKNESDEPSPDDFAFDAPASAYADPRLDIPAIPLRQTQDEKEAAKDRGDALHHQNSAAFRERAEEGRYIPKEESPFTSTAQEDEARLEKIRRREAYEKKLATKPEGHSQERTAALLAGLPSKSGSKKTEHLEKIQHALRHHTHKELAAIKEKLGIRASGTKAEQAKKLAERAAVRDRSNRRHYSHEPITVDEAVKLIRGHDSTAPGAAGKMANLLANRLTGKQLSEVKKKLGVKASGTKWETANRIIKREASKPVPQVSPKADIEAALAAHSTAGWPGEPGRLDPKVAQHARAELARIGTEEHRKENPRPPMHHTGGTWTKAADGSWHVKVPHGDARPGDTVTVRTKVGTEKTVELGETSPHGHGSHSVGAVRTEKESSPIPQTTVDTPLHESTIFGVDSQSASPKPEGGKVAHAPIDTSEYQTVHESDWNGRLGGKLSNPTTPEVGKAYVLRSSFNKEPLVRVPYDGGHRDIPEGAFDKIVKTLRDAGHDPKEALPTALAATHGSEKKSSERVAEWMGKGVDKEPVAPTPKSEYAKYSEAFRQSYDYLKNRVSPVQERIKSLTAQHSRNVELGGDYGLQSEIDTANRELSTHTAEWKRLRDAADSIKPAEVPAQPKQTGAPAKKKPKAKPYRTGNRIYDDEDNQEDYHA